MVQQLCVSGDRFWQALLHCNSPVYLLEHRNSDLRLLSGCQRDAVLPTASNDLSTISLYFHDKQDFIRFVLAYLLIEDI